MPTTRSSRNLALAIETVGLWHTHLMLRRGDNDDGNVFAPEEEQSRPLRSSKSPSDCPSSGFISSHVAEDTALEYLAEILVDAYLSQIKYGIKTKR